MKKNNLKAPFPYFGGKSSIAADIWSYLGDCKRYIEPFFGSGAVLLNRLNYNHLKHIETVCDADGNITNVWRSIKFSPKETARWCDWPVNQIDIISKKSKIIREQQNLVENLLQDEEYHNPKLAGYWIYGSSAWIGNFLNDGFNQIPAIGCSGRGCHKISLRYDPQRIYKWFEKLSNRLRYVQVVYGDWSRVCGGNWQDGTGDVGIYFDPPYGAEASRTNNLYNVDSLSVANDVRKWCLIRGSLPTYRIVLSGYFDEHKELLEHRWNFKKYTFQGGYANTGHNQGEENKSKETLFISPYCFKPSKNKLF